MVGADDWRSETQTRLEKSHVYKTLKKKCETDPSGNQVLSLVDDATYYAYQRTKTILLHMGEFTLHDGDHLFRVLHLMEKLVPHSTLDKFSIPELLLLIVSAFFHDIGMAPDVKAVLAWKKIWDASPVFNDDKDKSEYHKFLRYYSSKPDEQSEIKQLIKQGKKSDADLIKAYLITEYIRTTHAQRAKEIIKEHWAEKIYYRDTDLAVEFAEICFSHNEDALSLLELDVSFLCGPEIYACLPLVGVVLRLADLLDFDGKRTPQVLFSHLFVRHPISIKEWNKHRAVESWLINSETVQYHAKCKHPAIEASIHAFCDIIDKELSACNNVISVVNASNQRLNRDIVLHIPFKVDRSKIETQKDVLGEPKYIYRQTQFNLSKRQVIDLLMGTKLYGDPTVALRELLQNSIDACLLRRALETSWQNSYEPQINVKYYVENGIDILEVTDNGTGMDQHIIDSYYSKVGSSFYKSTEFYDLKSESKAQFTPTSRFGIGILSTFMVADTIEVDTRRIYEPHESSSPLGITIEGQESIFWIKPGRRKTPGTSTKLYLRKNKNPWERMTEEEFIESVEKVITNPPFKIGVGSGNKKKTLDENSFKKIHASSLKKGSLEKHDNVRDFSVELQDKSQGFVGSAIVSILERAKSPTNSFRVTSRSIEIDGSTYDLDTSMSMSDGRIELDSINIQIDEEANIEQSTSHNTVARSQSRVSLHGIEIPTTLFPERWNMQKGQVRLDWPMPILIVLDVCENRDLDLNSARTQIIMSERWLQFEEDLCIAIFSSIAASVSERYWNSLKSVLISKTKNNVFIGALERVERLRR